MNRLARDGTAEPVLRDQILRRERGQGNVHFPCSADHEQDWQPYPVDPHYCYMCDRAPIATRVSFFLSFIFLIWRHRFFRVFFVPFHRTFFLSKWCFLPYDHGAGFLHQLIM